MSSHRAPTREPLLRAVLEDGGASASEGLRTSLRPRPSLSAAATGELEPTPSELEAQRIGACSQEYFLRVHGPKDEIFRPAAAARATARMVDVSFALHDCSNIDAKAGTVDIDLSVFAVWEDPVLRAFAELELTPEDAESVWEPTVRLVNTTAVEELIDIKAERIRLANHRPLGSGNVWWRQHFICTLRNPMDLRAFPFDEDYIDVTVVASRYMRHQVVLRPNPRINHEELPIDADHGILEWVLMKPTVQELPQDVCRYLVGEPVVTTPAAHTMMSLVRSSVLLSLGVQRRPQYYLIKVMGIQAMLVIWSWAALYMTPDALADKMVRIARTHVNCARMRAC